MAQTLDNMTYTWNNGSTVFTGIKYNVADAASSASSLLMDLQVNGVSRFKVDKSGGSYSNIVYTNGYIGHSVSGAGGMTITIGVFNVSSQYRNTFSFSAGSFSINKDIFGTHQSLAWGTDLYLIPDAANALAQRNGTNAQTTRLYGTYTDGSNYRRLTQTMSTSGVAEIKPEGAGTGASGNVLYISGLPTTNPGPGILWNDSGTVKVGT